MRARIFLALIASWLFVAPAFAQSNNADGVGSLAQVQKIILYLFNGATWDRAPGDKTNGLKVNCVSGCSASGGASTAANQTAVQAATGAAPPANAEQAGVVGSGATGGLMAPMIVCDHHVSYDNNTNGATKIITGVSGRKTYICGFVGNIGATATNVKLVEGTGTNCGTGTANMTATEQLGAGGQWGFYNPVWGGLVTATVADDVCFNASAGNAVQAEVWYAIL